MIGFEEALSILGGLGCRAVEETVGLGDALGRVLARPVRSPVDSPPFDKAAMDGFAVRRGEEATDLAIQETVAAGSGPGRAVGPGECARIMTGAMMPPGAARVVRKEYVEERDGRARPARRESGDNVVPRGASLRAGDVVLEPCVLTDASVGILAASGIDSVPVAAPPRVAVLSTGSEIRPPGGALEAGQIYDSNGPQLRAQLSRMRCPARSFAAVEDEPQALEAAIAAAVAASDVVLVTGGVSAGDFDYVPGALASLGAQVLFHGVAVKPGKPTLCARLGDRFLFGLPGNPVSTYVIFELFVKPFLYRRMGIEWAAPVFRCRLGETVSRRSVDRMEFLPVRMRGGAAFPVPFHGSAHLNALGAADGLIALERGVASLEKGAEVDVRPL